MSLKQQNSPLTHGAHHIGLTVPDLDETRDFFVHTLRYEQIGEVPDYPAVFLSDGVTMITLWQTVDRHNATKFDRKNVVGLHHLALAVDNHQALDEVHQRLADAENVSVEFPPQARGDKGARHLMCAIPGGIRVEFFSPGSAN
jgi:catechol 2,3-dioxygenase-like lactoylglutathione lyase family enzyme